MKSQILSVSTYFSFPFCELFFVSTIFSFLRKRKSDKVIAFAFRPVSTNCVRSHKKPFYAKDPPSTRTENIRKRSILLYFMIFYIVILF